MVNTALINLSIVLYIDIFVNIIADTYDVWNFFCWSFAAAAAAAAAAATTTTTNLLSCTKKVCFFY